VQVEVWSDVVCPFCYIGKRQLEQALEQFEHADEVEVTWRSFELDPGAPAERAGDNLEHLARKYGMSRSDAQAAQDRVQRIANRVDLHLDFERARGGNTFDAHRLLHLAADHGRQDDLEERLFAGHFTEGRRIGDADELRAMALEAGLAEADVDRVLGSDEHADAVRADEAAARALGVSGVPFFVVDRAYGVSGAQGTETLLEVLQRAWGDAHPLTMVTGAGGDACAVGGSDPTC
jgi:predicted DsbA family dithiol-disulfide isomerase